MPVPLVLASTSPYRRDLLARLGLEFDVASPGVEETPRAGETPEALAARLALAKARAVSRSRPGCLVLGSDQVADLDGRPLGKPGTSAAATAQLLAMSGREVVFHTAVALCGDGGQSLGQARDRTRVRLRTLGRAEVEAYVDRENPVDCAGAFRCEGLGIALFEAIDSEDPTALVGLPLIAVCRLLREAGVPVLGAA